jgi:hypothetical protein
VEYLKPGEDGKAKGLHANRLTKLSDFLQMFDVRNVTNDAELQTLVDKCKKVFDGVEVKDLKKDTALRDMVLQGLAPASQELASMVTARPARAISFEDV